MDSAHDATDTRDGPLAIEAAGLTKHFDEVVAVEDLDLAIERGVVYGFLGPNGSGKTTTMRMLTSLTRPTGGEARIMDVDVRDRRELIQHIGYLPEEPPLFDELTGREQLRHVAALHDIPAAAADERIQRYLDRFDLAGAADRRQEGYSTGMRKKVGLIQAILHDPPVIFLDEPTSGLDPRAARTVKDLIAELADRETTIFLSTHILSVVDELADEVGVLHDGRLVAEGPPADLKRRAERGEAGSLEDVFLAVTTDHAEEYATAEGEMAGDEANEEAVAPETDGGENDGDTDDPVADGPDEDAT
jgi:ABC-2 type transport system ATP-binding protein